MALRGKDEKGKQTRCCHDLRVALVAALVMQGLTYPRGSSTVLDVNERSEDRSVWTRSGAHRVRSKLLWEGRVTDPREDREPDLVSFTSVMRSCVFRVSLEGGFVQSRRIVSQLFGLRGVLLNRGHRFRNFQFKKDQVMDRGI